MALCSIARLREWVFAMRLQPLGFLCALRVLCGESQLLELRAARETFRLHLGLERISRSLPA